MIQFKVLFLSLLMIGIVSAKSASLKQGGSACYPLPDYCMNGGTCYTQYTTQPVTIPPPTTTPCTEPETTTTTTTTTTQRPTTTQYVIITQPVCGCHPQYVGDRCETPITTAYTTQAPATTHAPLVTYAPVVTPAPSRCATHQCLNGGTCLEINVFPLVICSCPAAYTGNNCETLLEFSTTPIAPFVCYNGGSPVVTPLGSVCQCLDAFTGNQCETVIPVFSTTTAPVLTSPCAIRTCLNGGECREIDVNPYSVCVCPVGFTGTACEVTLTFAPTTQAPVTYPQTTQAPVTYPPVTFAPITQAPVTYPPVTFAPITQAPVTYPPVTQAPVTYPPVTQPACQTPAPVVTTATTYHTTQTTQPACQTPAPTSQCASRQCLNGGFCREINISPYSVCVCTADWTGSNCETRLTFVTPTYEPTIAPTAAPVSYTNAPVVTQPTTTHNMANLCQVYASRNMNICQNGGRCVFIAAGRISCICPSDFVGQYCETPVYNTCLGGIQSRCNREHGTCQYDGSCQCEPGWCGPSCDNAVEPVTPAPSRCLTYQCYNGGTCVDISIDPFAICQCPAAYTGNQCETLIQVAGTTQSSLTCLNGGTLVNTAVGNACICTAAFTGNQCETLTVVTNSYVTQSSLTCLNGGTLLNTPFGDACVCSAEFTGLRCETRTTVTTGPYGNVVQQQVAKSPSMANHNFTIKLLNEGAYTARFKVNYMVDKVHQPTLYSDRLPIIGNRAQITIPWYATNVIVTMEKLGGDWSFIASDSGIDTDSYMEKCYKVWGDVVNAKWDYVNC